MPVIITKDSKDYYLVPAPLVSFSRSTYSNIGRPQFGADFAISLEGYLVPEKGNPFYDMTAGSTQPGNAIAADGDAEVDGRTWTKPSRAEAGAANEPNYGNDPDYLLASTLRKQEMLRSLFSTQVPYGAGSGAPIMVNITNWGETTNGLKFAAFVDDISFDSSSRGVKPQSYTVNLRCDNFLDSANGNFGANNDEIGATYAVTNITESFDIAEDNRVNVTFLGEGVDAGLDKVHKIYTVTRSTTVVGAPVYDENGAYVSGAPWEQASGYVYNILGTGTEIIPTGRHEFLKQFGADKYKIANRVIGETVDKEEGSYTINDTFTAYSGDPVIHSLNIDVATAENERRSVTVQGTIEGLNTTDAFAFTKNNFLNASGFNARVNPAQGISSGYYYGKALAQLDWLNPIPKSRSIAKDIQGGSISYNYSFDDRPPNLVSGSISESITINDTYPGELFSATPVIGRNQPILQYLNSRSEYKRSLNISIIMGEAKDKYGANTNNWAFADATGGYWKDATYQNIQKWLITDKPSKLSPSSGDLAVIFKAANPVEDPTMTVRNGKCFHSVPAESWDAFSRTYTYSIEWTYERDI